MKDIIKALGEHANRLEVDLHREVVGLGNNMDECSCDDSVRYDFSNTYGHYEVHVYCLNCGGWIDVKDLEI